MAAGYSHAAEPEAATPTAETGETTSATVDPAANFTAPQEERTSLDVKIQNLKKEVLELNRDLFILEEELLFPATSQIAVFLSMDIGEFFRLDSVKVKINDKVVGHHLYTERESRALYKGGVQRLYLGNIKTGKHELVAVFTGKGPHNRDYRRGATTVFEKTTGALYLELQIVDSEVKQQPEFVIKQWE
ncbi:MAG TPA: AraC family transcriptional regulator [Gammaproteobacteria bacterium]|nr:AraC family transcriptional regulator [Gammaproteobacteria bacterium]